MSAALRPLAAQARVGRGALDHLRDVCDVLEDDVTEWGRDRWPLAIACRAAAVLRPTTADQVADVLRICNDERYVTWPHPAGRQAT